MKTAYLTMQMKNLYTLLSHRDSLLRFVLLVCLLLVTLYVQQEVPVLTIGILMLMAIFLSVLDPIAGLIMVCIIVILMSQSKIRQLQNEQYVDDEVLIHNSNTVTYIQEETNDTKNIQHHKVASKTAEEKGSFLGLDPYNTSQSLAAFHNLSG